MTETINFPIPSYMDANFIKNKLGIEQPWGYGPTSDSSWQVIIFDKARLEEVEAAIQTYDADFLFFQKQMTSTRLANIRWLKTQRFTYDGVLTHADQAMAVVLGALELRRRRSVPAGYQQTWKLNENQFRKWTEADIETFGFAISDHIQACFDNEEAISDLIWAATSLEELDAIDITVGWPE